jgi:hypothetical protein
MILFSLSLRSSDLWGLEIMDLNAKGAYPKHLHIFYVNDTFSNIVTGKDVENTLFPFAIFETIFPSNSLMTLL